MFNNQNLDIKRGIILPKETSEKLAEFFGILAGDGYVNFKNDHDYTVSIAGHKIDDELYHLKYIYPLFRELFGLNPKINIKLKQNGRYIYIRSKTIVNFIKSNYFYKYKGKIDIPDWIFENKKYFNSFLRGLVDTDGSVAIKKRYKSIPYYPVISITIKNKDLTEKIANYLKENRFTVWWGISNKKNLVYRVELSGIKNLNLWKDKISFSNQKHISKFNHVINREWAEGDLNSRL